MVTAAGIYARISDDEGGAALGVARQEVDCRQLAQRLGWPVAGTYVDNDTSAFRARPRPEYQRMCEDLRAGRLDAVLAYRPDRLYRRATDLEAFIALVEERGAQVATVAAGALDFTTAEGRMVARLVGATAQAEVERLSERTRRALAENLAAGKPGGGGRAFGYKVGKLEIEDSEAAEIRAAVAKVLEGTPLRAIVRDWRERIPTVAGAARWSQNTVRRILISPRVAGLREYKGQVTGPAAWPAIIDPATRDELLVLLKPGRRGSAEPAQRKYLLTGLAYCGECGVKLTTRPKRGYSMYVCPPRTDGGCGRVAIKCEGLDDLVRTHLTGGVLPGWEPETNAAGEPDVPEDHVIPAAVDWLAMARASVPEVDTETVERELRALEARAVELAELWAVGAITSGPWGAATRRLEARAKELREKRDAAVRERQEDRGWRAALALIEGFPERPVTEQRRLVEQVVERVIVSRQEGRWTKGWADPRRVELVWCPSPSDSG